MNRRKKTTLLTRLDPPAGASVYIWTDASFDHRYVIGGYGYYMTCNGQYASKGVRDVDITDNNRGELLAIVRAVQIIRQACKVTVYTDSQYVLKREDGNSELWAELDALARLHQLTVRQVDKTALPHLIVHRLSRVYRR